MRFKFEICVAFFKSTNVKLSLGRYRCWLAVSCRGYRPIGSHWFGTDMIYNICLFRIPVHQLKIITRLRFQLIYTKLTWNYLVYPVYVLFGPIAPYVEVYLRMHFLQMSRFKRSWWSWKSTNGMYKCLLHLISIIKYW